MNKGFTLIELSIVLIIISLVVAGVTGGRLLIHAAEIRNVITDANTFKTAIYAFKLQFDELPGDIPNAWDYWGNPAAPLVAGGGRQLYK